MFCVNTMGIFNGDEQIAGQIRQGKYPQEDVSCVTGVSVYAHKKQ